MATSAALDAAAVAAAGTACVLAGRAAQRARLPQITGFLVAGIVAGPAGFGLITARLLARLAPVEAAGLGAIALAAGAELHLSELQRTRRQVLCITAAVAVVSWLAVGGCLLAAAPAVPFLRTLERHELWAVASLGGTLAMARSPASAIAVLRETEAQGPFCSLVMAVVVVKDVLVFVAFATNLEIVSAAMRHSAGGASLAAMAHPAVGLAMSASLGVGGGAVLGAMLATNVPGALRPRVAEAAVLRAKPAAVFAAAAAVYFAAVALDAEPLLACVTAGLVVANRRSEGASRDVQEELVGSLAALMPAVNPVFFGIVGASVRLRSLVADLWAAAGLAGVRGCAVWAGSWLGGTLGRAEPDIRRRLWQGMVTQAGIAMGLAKAVAARFPSWGQDFSTLMIGVILINMLSGPSLFRAAIVALGESRRRGFQDADSRTLTKGGARSPRVSEHLALELPQAVSPRSPPQLQLHPVAGGIPSPRRQHHQRLPSGGGSGTIAATHAAGVHSPAMADGWQGFAASLHGQGLPPLKNLQTSSTGSAAAMLHVDGDER